MALAAAVGLAHRLLIAEPVPVGFLYANGQLEATEVRVSAEVQGRVLESELTEGKRVEHGDRLVALDPAALETQLAEARAQALALDEAEQAISPQIRRILRRLARQVETTIFVSTHYLAEARRCDRVAFMNQGRLLVSAPPARVAAEWGDGELETAFVRLIAEDRRSNRAEEGQS